MINSGLMTEVPIIIVRKNGSDPNIYERKNIRNETLRSSTSLRFSGNPTSPKLKSKVRDSNHFTNIRRDVISESIDESEQRRSNSVEDKMESPKAAEKVEFFPPEDGTPAAAALAGNYIIQF